jgi:adenylate kinase family enzyme
MMDPTFPALDTMGNRIMVLGPTNAGKSTFTIALAKKLGVPPVHLDQYRHLPDTLYVPRPDAEFQTLHDAAIAWPGWVMDGSYSAVMPQRIARATAIIVLDESLLVRTRRYIWRTLFQRDRAGALEGNKDRLTLAMFAWLWKTRNNSTATRTKATATGLPTVFAFNAAETDALYAAWGLTREVG